MAKIRVMIADDHNVLRDGLRMLIDAQDDMTVVSEATSGDEVLPQARATRPGVILLDVTMPGITGLELLPQIRQEVPETHVLVLTMHDDPAYYRLAVLGGALGYVLKRATSAELLAAIRAVAEGKGFVDLATARTIVQDRIADVNQRARPSRPPGTPRVELDAETTAVLRLLAQGMTMGEAATRLHVSIKTVEKQRARLYRQLGVRSRAELVRYAAEAGLLGSDNGG
jgi:DNA-binding NarL/FixJ family response regulator